MVYTTSFSLPAVALAMHYDSLSRNTKTVATT